MNLEKKNGAIQDKTTIIHSSNVNDFQKIEQEDKTIPDLSVKKKLLPE